MSKVMKWRYKGQADIIFGEVKPSPVPKIILAVIISIVVLSGISCFLLRNYIYDLAFNPHVELNLTQENDNYYIDLDVNSEFNLYDYIDESRTLKYDKFISDNNKYICEVEGEIDTSKVGEYPITYKSSNRIRSQEIPVTVRVSDNEAPVITLSTKTDTIDCTNDVIKAFDPESYIVEAKDNYYDVTVEYHITDDNGNEISKEDIQSLYVNLDWLGILPDDVDTYANDLINTNTSDEQEDEDTDKDDTNIINEDLVTWGNNYLQVKDKYKNDIIGQIEPVHNYSIEYIIIENSENARIDTAQIELVIIFDENIIVNKLNNNRLKLIELGVLSDVPDVIEDTKPTEGHSGTQQPTNPDNSGGNSGGNSGSNIGGNQPNPWDNDATYSECPYCHEWFNSNDIANHKANCPNK